MINFPLGEDTAEMKIIGLTGGVGSGKSSVARYFSELGVPVIDADILAHQLVIKGMPALTTIQKQFGSEVLDAQGNLNRAKMRSLIFSPPLKNNPYKQKLESILHPLISQAIKQQLNTLKELPTPPCYCIIVVPLLIEKWDIFKEIIDEIVVVDVPENLQVSRLLQRENNLNSDEALAIIQSQVTRETRLAMAKMLILNTGNLEDLKKKVYELHSLFSL